MQIKLLEDLIALAQTGSFTKAARLRHVTHPAFGRRIKALEAWAGAPLIIRDTSPIHLTPFGGQMLETAKKTLALLENTRRNQHNAQTNLVKIATGRTLARTLVADWVSAMNSFDATKTSKAWSLKTGSLATATRLLEIGDVDFMIAYEHPSIGLKLDSKVFDFLTLASDKLIPVATTAVSQLLKVAGTKGKVSTSGTSPMQMPIAIPYIAFDHSLALAKIIEERVADSFWQTRIQTVATSDSPDAVHALALKGLGLAWLPWSLVVNDVKSKRLTVLGKSDWQINFDVRIYRRKTALSTLGEKVWQQTIAIYQK